MVLIRQLDVFFYQAGDGIRDGHVTGVQTCALPISEIKRMHDELDEYSADDMIKDKQAPIARRPLFMQEEKKLTGAEIGTAVHADMQHRPLERPLTEGEIEEIVAGRVNQEILTGEEAEVIDRHIIVSFFETEIAQLMMETEGIEREVPFSVTLPASEVYTDWEAAVDERVLIQGVIDCLIPGEDGWILLDYKTDAIVGEVTEDVYYELKTRYEVQMNLRSEEHTSELQSRGHLVCRLLLEKKK